MQFDDRLATVLRHRATGERSARTQFRQLLDLLGNMPGTRSDGDRNLIASAWLRLGALGEILPVAERVAMIRDPGLRFRSPELAAHLAEDEPDVAVAALTRAELTDDGWQDLIPRLPIRARGFLRLRRDMPTGAAALLDRLGIHDRGLPRPDTDNIKLVSQAAPPAADARPEDRADDRPDEREDDRALDSEIGALVKRIEAFRHARLTEPGGNKSPRLPFGDKRTDLQQPRLLGFSFTADADGRVDWADIAVAPMMVGRRLKDDPSIAVALLSHQPIRQQPITLEGGPLIAGEWVIDAAPRFTSPGGRFYGYAGKFRRPARDAVIAPLADDPVRESEADRIRQLLHELRTPVNAIQGFSEIIQQQLFGPTPHEYRALAASIAGDSARILAGFDELDRLARLETGSLDMEEGCADLRSILEQTTAQLQEVLKPRSSSLAIHLGEGSAMIAMSAGECEALVWRLLATLTSATGTGEHIRLSVEPGSAEIVLRCDIPASLRSLSNIFSATIKPFPHSLSAGVFGAGFALRLVRAEAKASGGDLTSSEGQLVLRLPMSLSIAEGPGKSNDTA